jgi:hypothetical protein
MIDRGLPVLGILLFLVGCGSGFHVQARPDAEQNLGEPLEDGTSSQEKLLLRFGTPSFQLDEPRMLAYRMTLDEQENLIVVPPSGRGGWDRAEFSLVLVFDDRGILVRHGLIQVKER